MKPELSIVITYHNEGQEFINECVKQIRETADMKDYEIIIVDDCSDKPITVEGAYVIRHDKNKGVGAAQDTGVGFARADNVIFMMCDIRFIANQWMSKMYNTINEYPKSLICSQCIALSLEKEKGLDLNHRRKINMVAGAVILLYHNHGNDKGKPTNFKSLIHSKWRKTNKEEKGIIEVPSILGSFYGTKKEWYQYIDGFYGHKIWGALEPLISLKSWLFGGDPGCICDKRIETGHIFRKKSVHKISQAAIYHNKLWALKTLFEEETIKGLMEYLPRDKNILGGESLLDMEMLDTKRDEYQAKRVISDKELFEKTGIEVLKKS